MAELLDGATTTEGRSKSDRPGSAARRARSWLVLLGALGVVALAACSAGGAETNSSTDATTLHGPQGTINEGTPVDGGSVVFGVSAESNGWNPALNQWTDSGSLVGSSVLEPLAAVGSDKQAAPFLATSWTPNADSTSWTVKLRPGVTFQNGEKFDAAAVKKNFDFFLTGPLTSMALSGVLTSTTVVDDQTVRFDMSQPWGAFPNSILDGPFYMMAPAMLALPDQGQAHPIGTGPFTFDSWQRDNSFKAVKNPNYWQKGLPHLDSIEFKVIPDSTSRMNALKSGNINALLTTRAQDSVTADGQFTVVKDWNSENVFVMTNVSPTIDGVANPLSNIHARKALAYATDREAVAAQIGDGIDIPTSPWGPENVWGQPDDQNGYVDFDLERAKSEVDAYKSETGQPSLTISLNAISGGDDSELLQVLQSQWGAAGINLTINQLEETAFISNTVTSKYQAAISRNYAFPDPDTAYSFWSSANAKGSGNLSINMTQYTTPQLDAALQKGRESTDLKTRQDAYHDVAKQLNTGVTHIWLYRTPYSLISATNVKGWNTARSSGFSAYGPRTWLGELWVSK
jgi:ABC-type transport system substrate-binding protein